MSTPTSTVATASTTVVVSQIYIGITLFVTSYVYLWRKYYTIYVNDATISLSTLLFRGFYFLWGSVIIVLLLLRLIFTFITMFILREDKNVQTNYAFLTPFLTNYKPYLYSFVFSFIVYTIFKWYVLKIQKAEKKEAQFDVFCTLMLLSFLASIAFFNSRF